jgi:hypothetical protein
MNKNMYYTRAVNNHDINFNKGTVTPGLNNYLCCKRRLARKEKRLKQGVGSPLLPKNGEERVKKKKMKTQKQARENFDNMKCGIVEDDFQECEGQHKIVLDLVTAALRLGQSLEGSGDIRTLVSQVLQVVNTRCDKNFVSSVESRSPSAAVEAADAPEVVVDAITEKHSPVDPAVREAEIPDEVCEAATVSDEVAVDTIKEELSCVDSEAKQTEVTLMKTPSVFAALGDYETDQSALQRLDPRGSCPYPIVREEKPGDDVSQDFWCGRLECQTSLYVLPSWLVREVVVTVKRWWRSWGAVWVHAKVFTGNSTDSIDYLNRECKQTAVSALHAVESRLFQHLVIGCPAAELFDALKGSMRCCYLTEDRDVHYLANQAARLDKLVYQHTLIETFLQWCETQ